MAKVQDIRRAISMPPMPPDAPEWFAGYFRQFQLALAQQLQLFLSSFENRVIAVAGGLATLNLVWTSPAPDATYTVFLCQDWNSTSYVTARTTTQASLNWGTASPGGGGTAYVLRVR